MSKILWNSLLVSPAVLGAALVVSASAIAAESGARPEVAKAETAAETQLSAPAARAVGDVAVASVAVAEIAATGSQEPAASSTEGLGAAAEVPVLTAARALEQPEVASVMPAAAEVPVQRAAAVLENPEAAAAENPAVAAEMPAAVTEVPVLAASKALENSQVAPVVAEEQINVTPGEAPVAEKAQVPQQVAQMQPAPANPAAAEVLQQLNRYTNEGASNRNSAGQVTSVSQLSDVQPTDWAFQALQNLVERYGCIAGYPDGTYRGNRALTRYEFAAGLNACLERIVQLIQQPIDTSNFVTKADLATLNRLLEEFQAELATLRGRVDALEARTAELEANQFSTTTKLVGEAIFAATDGIGSGSSSVPVLQQRVRLNLNTSFTGSDLLITRLQVGNSTPLDNTNINQGIAFPTGTSEGFQTHQVFGDTGNQFVLDTLQYQFPLGDRIRVFVAANAGIFDDFTPTLNPYFENFDGGSGSIGAFAQRNPIYRLGGGQGIGLSWKWSQALELTAGYLAAEGFSPSAGNGFFKGDFAALGQITWTPSERFGAAVTYNHAYFGPGRFGFDNGAGHLETGTAPFTGTALANRVGATQPVTSDSVGLQLAWRISSGVQLNGWAGYTRVDLRDADVRGDIWNGAIGLAFPDLGKEGNVAGVLVGVEPYLTELEGFGEFFKNDVPLHVEAFYKYQVTDNISITPGVIWLNAPNQDADNDDVFVGTIRTTFSF